MAEGAAAPDDLEGFRRDAALAILIEMINTGGDRLGKIWAAVDYANGLVARLRETAVAREGGRSVFGRDHDWYPTEDTARCRRCGKEVGGPSPGEPCPGVTETVCARCQRPREDHDRQGRCPC